MSQIEVIIIMALIILIMVIKMMIISISQPKKKYILINQRNSIRKKTFQTIDIILIIIMESLRLIGKDKNWRMSSKNSKNCNSML